MAELRLAGKEQRCAAREFALFLRVDGRRRGYAPRHATVRLVNPPYANGQEFRDWLDTTVAQLRPALIVPSEACLLALRPQLARYAHLLPGADDPERLYRAFSKHDVLQSFAAAADPALREQLPPALPEGRRRARPRRCTRPGAAHRA